tara:strand:+ start:262 stop:783 length:522 start_codon:yes stop_codon:yes gene_type:complete
MLKASFSFILLVLIPIVAVSQNLEVLKKQALSDAEKTANAMMTLDFQTILDYTHPVVLEKMGGAQTFLPQLEDAYKKMEAEGLKFLKAEVIGVSDIIHEQGEYRCYVENTNIMKVQEMTFKSQSYLLGFYLEDKKHWVFIEADKIKSERHKSLFFPDFETSLDIPKDVLERID